MPNFYTVHVKPLKGACQACTHLISKLYRVHIKILSILVSTDSAVDAKDHAHHLLHLLTSLNTAHLLQKLAFEKNVYKFFRTACDMVSEKDATNTLGSQKNREVFREVSDQTETSQNFLG